MGKSEAEIIDGLKIICVCRAIRKKVFLDLIAAGARNVGALQQATGAGSGDCRGKRCTQRIMELLQSADRSNSNSKSCV